VEIEKTAVDNPDAIKTLNVNYVQGLQPYQCRDMGFALGLNAKQVGQLSKIMLGLYKLFNEKDLALVELNPLAILTDGNLACSTARSIPTTTPTSAIPSWWRCATSSRKTRPKCWPASTTSTT
jgi:succinyl-CoA synthetase beta subunit